MVDFAIMLLPLNSCLEYLRGTMSNFDNRGTCHPNEVSRDKQLNGTHRVMHIHFTDTSKDPV